MECVTISCSSRWPRLGKFKSAYSLTRMRPLAQAGAFYSAYISIHAFPHKNATRECSRSKRTGRFQSTHSLTRMRPVLKFHQQSAKYFNPRIPSQECDRRDRQDGRSLTNFNPRIPSQECDYNTFHNNSSFVYFNPRIPSQECDIMENTKDYRKKHFNPRIPSQECDSKNYQFFFYSLQFLIPIVPLLAQKLNHYILIAPYFTKNSQFSSANPPAFSCPLRIRTMCLLRFSPTALYLL